MQTLQLQATYNPGVQFPQTIEMQVATTAKAGDDNLDEALALVLQAVRQSSNPKSMDALGTLLGYMEKLEREQVQALASETCITLVNPLNLSFQV